MAVKSPFPIIAVLCAVAMAYKNEDMIADLVLPFVQVDGEEFYYLDYRKTDVFKVLETEVGRTSLPETVTLEADKELANVVDHALRGEIPMKDINRAAQAAYKYDPEQRMVAHLQKLLALAREVRTARLVFNPATYSRKIKLEGTSKFDGVDSDPIGVINTGLDSSIMRPNTMTLGQDAWRKLRTHPDIMKAINRTDGDKGMATREQVKELFEIKNLFVGQGWVNTAREGQAPQMARVWGSNISLIHQDTEANADSGITFGYTARWEAPWGGSQFDKNIGAQGGMDVRTGSHIKEMITAPELGYYIEDV